jgi:hypothetical protein
MLFAHWVNLQPAWHIENYGCTVFPPSPPETPMSLSQAR